MGVILRARQTLFVDTAPLIYFFGEHELYAPLMAAILDDAAAKDVRIVTSMITYIELLTLPRRVGDERLAAKYREYLTNSRQVSLYPLNTLVADAAVDFRAAYGLKTPDAIQLGVARVCGADLVITNDRDWRAVKGLSVVTLSDMLKDS